MEEQDHQTADTWKQFLLEELIWVLQTMGVITLSLAIGRMISILAKEGGINIDLLNSDWMKQVNESLAAREQQHQHDGVDYDED